MSTEEFYAFGDTETDGLGRDTNLLEIAVLMTDSQLNILDEEGYSAVISYTEEEVETMRANALQVVVDMHDKSGLWKRLTSPEAKSKEVIDAELYEYIKSFAPNKRQARIAGNSLRLDMNMLEWNLPLTYNHLHYRVMDVSTLADVAEKWYGIVCPPKEMAHEAMADIVESIDQARYLRNRLGITIV